MDILQEFHGPNFGYILELFEKYQTDPESLDPKTVAYLKALTPILNNNGTVPPPEQTTPSLDILSKTTAAVRLSQAIRHYGHLGAKLNPLETIAPTHPNITLDYYDLTEADLRQLPASIIGGTAAQRTNSAWEAIQFLRTVYCANLGFDYEHVFDTNERIWLREAIEGRRYSIEQTPFNQEELLKILTKVESFEHFLHRIFPGKTRFSIEGLDTMVPLIEEILHGASESGIHSMLIGMAHRGRLNMMAHVLHKPYGQILAEFKDTIANNFTQRDEHGWTGDVKYHLGVQRNISSSKKTNMQVTIVPNPSHLEHVNPVVEGMVRAIDTNVDKQGPAAFNHLISIPLIIHGDAAFAGQGIVAETLNMANISGYRTGGTIHIIANNQLGFTTPAVANRSTLYASDPAKGYRIPIIHVNADDPEACIEAARIALQFRIKFQRDFVIDLIGYRRYGHNEGDEPRFTQPQMYQIIDKHQTVRKIYADKLVAQKIISPDLPDQLVTDHMNLLQKIYESLKPQEELDLPALSVPPKGAAQKTKTAVPADKLQKINHQLLHFPVEFKIHRKISRIMEKRINALDNKNERTIDWGFAEQLAFASILSDGTGIRVTGEDAERGTFSHRHAVFYDSDNGESFIPLQNFKLAEAAFEIRNSPLSENAAVGFEYGYNIQAPERLVIWEAQYGDFVNGAQAIIDEFVVSGRAKWGQTPSLVMLLPHGHEGQGPDHSTGRLERFLQLAAETNMRIANCTTAAQYFHLLRRQAALLVTDPLPLIIMAPKSLLRHPITYSTLAELSEGKWYPVIDDPLTQKKRKLVERLILCSGKVYADLMHYPERKNKKKIGIARLEQIYPFPAEKVLQLVAKYPNLKEVVWLQEEPKNMGAWTYLNTTLPETITTLPVRYIGRPRRSSPAEGSTTWHNRNQSQIIDAAYSYTELESLGD